MLTDPVEIPPVYTGVVGVVGFVLEKIVFPFQVQVSCVDFGSFSYFFHVLSHTALASVSAILYLADLSIEKLVFIVSVPRVIALELFVVDPVFAGVVGFGVTGA